MGRGGALLLSLLFGNSCFCASFYAHRALMYAKAEPHAGFRVLLQLALVKHFAFVDLNHSILSAG